MLPEAVFTRIALLWHSFAIVIAQQPMLSWSYRSAKSMRLWALGHPRYIS